MLIINKTKEISFYPMIMNLTQLSMLHYLKKKLKNLSKFIIKTESLIDLMHMLQKEIKLVTKKVIKVLFLNFDRQFFIYFY